MVVCKSLLSASPSVLQEVPEKQQTGWEEFRNTQKKSERGLECMEMWRTWM